MAKGDNRARFTDGVDISREIAGGTVKADPVAMPRLPEDTDSSGFYAGVGVTAVQADELPEHKARRDAYPLITQANA